MIALAVLAVVLAALAQVMLASQTVAGVLPLIGLLVAAWLGYRYRPHLVLPLMLITGFVSSFYALNPNAILLAYALAGLILFAGFMVTADESRLDKSLSSTIIITTASFVLVLTASFSLLGTVSLLQSMTYLLLTALFTGAIWWLMVQVAGRQA